MAGQVGACHWECEAVGRRGRRGLVSLRFEETRAMEERTGRRIAKRCPIPPILHLHEPFGPPFDTFGDINDEDPFLQSYFLASNSLEISFTSRRKYLFMNNRGDGPTKCLDTFNSTESLLKR